MYPDFDLFLVVVKKFHVVNKSFCRDMSFMADHVVLEDFSPSGRGDMEGFVADVFLEQSFVVFAPVHL